MNERERERERGRWEEKKLKIWQIEKNGRRRWIEIERGQKTGGETAKEKRHHRNKRKKGSLSYWATASVQ